MVYHKVNLEKAIPADIIVGKNKVTRRMAEEVKEVNWFYDEANGTKVVRTIEDKVFGPAGHLWGIITTNESRLIDGRADGKIYTPDAPLVLYKNVVKEFFDETDNPSAYTETEFRRGGTRKEQTVRESENGLLKNVIKYDNNGMPIKR